MILCFLIFSCYTQKVTLNADKKSGQVAVEYYLDDDYFQLLSIAIENFNAASTQSSNKFDPAILMDAAAIKEYFKDNKFIKIRSVSVDTSNGYRGKITADFTDFEKMFESIPKGVTNLSLKKEPDLITVTQLLNLKSLDPEGVFKSYIMKQKEDDIAYYNKLTRDVKFTFVIATASMIKKTEGVVLSGDKKVASYTFKLNDLLINDNKTYKFLISL